MAPPSSSALEDYLEKVLPVNEHLCRDATLIGRTSKHMKTRKEIAERAVAKWEAGGFSIERDPEFEVLLKLWVAGDLSIDAIRRRYLNLLQERERGNRPG